MTIEHPGPVVTGTVLADPSSAEEEEAKIAGDDASWVRRYLADSIYLWACGEKAETGHDNPTLSDRFIGWAILLMQGLVYTLLIFRAKFVSKPGMKGYAMTSIVGAMYILVASTTSDLRAGFSLTMDGPCVGHRVFGIGLLFVFVLMITASIRVLMSAAEDDASVVINAVTVLFVADLDEKALKFFLTVPQKWRLFWALHSLGISFVLALVAVVYAGDPSLLTKKTSNEIGNDDYYFTIGDFPSWFFWAVNPGAVTLCASTLSACMQAVSESCSTAYEQVDSVTSCGVVGAVSALVVLGPVKSVKRRFREEPVFYTVLILWLADGVVTWFDVLNDCRLPVAWEPSSSYVSDSFTDEYDCRGFLTVSQLVAFLFANTALTIGFVTMVVRMMPRYGGRHANPELARSSGRNRGTEYRSYSATSRVPSVLVGWGIGFWVMSGLYLLCIAWKEGGWWNAPTGVEVVGYVIVPCLFLVGILIVAKTDFLGHRLGGLMKPAVDILRDRRRVWYWIAVTVLRDVLLLWMYGCYVMMQFVDKV